MRLQAIEALGWHPGPASVAALLQRLEASGQAEELAAAATALGRLAAVEAAPRLARLLATDRPAGLRQAAVVALARIGGPEAVAALVTLIGDGDPLIELQAIQALGGLGNSAAAGPLMARFAIGLGGFRDADAAVLLAASAAWERELDSLTAVLRALIRLLPLGGGGYLERAAAGRGLPGGSAAALALADAQYRLRLVALEALGKLPRGGGLAFLTAFAGNGGSDPRLRGGGAGAGRGGARRRPGRSRGCPPGAGRAARRPGARGALERLPGLADAGRSGGGGGAGRAAGTRARRPGAAGGCRGGNRPRRRGGKRAVGSVRRRGCQITPDRSFRPDRSGQVAQARSLRPGRSA